MKIQGAKKVHYDSGPNMTPLVDVVMVILIFLMLAGSFSGLSHFLKANMPVGKEGKGKIDPTGLDKYKNISVQIRNVNGTIRAVLDDGHWYAIPDPEHSDKLADDLVAALEKKREAIVSTGAEKDKVQVMIAPANDTKQRIVMKVYEAAMKANFQNVGFTLPSN